MMLSWYMDHNDMAKRYPMIPYRRLESTIPSEVGGFAWPNSNRWACIRVTGVQISGFGMKMPSNWLKDVFPWMPCASAALLNCCKTHTLHALTDSLENIQCKRRIKSFINDNQAKEFK